MKSKGRLGEEFTEDILNPGSVVVSCVKISSVMILAAVLCYFLFRNMEQNPTEWVLISSTVLGLFFLLPLVLLAVRRLEKQSRRILSLQHHMIKTIADVIEERDSSTGGHIVRTANLVEMLLNGMAGNPKFPQVTQAYIEKVKEAAPLHDVGKIKIPDNVLNKPGKLSAVEYEVMKKHSEFGADLIHRCIKDLNDRNYFSIAYNIALFHHERYDGRGYPTGMSGEQIPLEARVMALADVYDALVSPRVYKEPFPKIKAIEIIKEGRGTQFDPDLTDIFIDCVKKRQDL